MPASRRISLTGAERGETTFARQHMGWTVTEVSNQSTRYCPEPSSWPVVAAACDKAGLPHPGRFTTAFQFRRCPACDQLTIVKDHDFTCAACGRELPTAWNASR
ncbi:hypothetical protein AB0C02_29455 [Micromonospora sp. NPDC048999]|uniref:hypothetical protein n=1 Tax=Micromonospora sp. NPDC048999 TaxID=3155391 RepID=UPI0033D77385